MLSPIAQACNVHGEWAILKTPGATTQYDPTSLVDWAPADDGSIRVRGFEADKETSEGMPSNAKAAFTIQASCMPPGLVPEKSTLVRDEVAYTIVGYRTRRFRGRIDGYTLFLAI